MIAKFTRLTMGSGKWCNFVKEDFNSEATGWMFSGDYNREFELFVWKLMENGILDWWRKLEGWSNEFVEIPNLGDGQEKSKMKKGRTSSLALSGNGKHVFEIYCILLSVSIMYFLLVEKVICIRCVQN